MLPVKGRAGRLPTVGLLYTWSCQAGGHIRLPINA